MSFGPDSALTSAHGTAPGCTSCQRAPAESRNATCACDVTTEAIAGEEDAERSAWECDVDGAAADTTIVLLNGDRRPTYLARALLEPAPWSDQDEVSLGPLLWRDLSAEPIYVDILRATAFNMNPSLGATEDFVLVRSIEASTWSSGVLIVLCHANVLDTGQSATVLLEGASYSPEQPGQTFVARSSTAAITLTESDAPGTALIAELATPMPATIRAVLRLTQSAVVASTMPFTISAHVIGRTGRVG